MSFSSALGGILLGLMGVAVTISWMTHCHRRNRLAQKERSPQQKKLLRPAGYSLQCRMEALNEGLQHYLVASLGGGIISGLCLVALWPFFQALTFGEFTWDDIVNLPKFYMLVATGLLMVGTFGATGIAINRTIRSARELRNARLGWIGEQAVAEALSSEQIAKASYRVFHDVPGEGHWNIDHVVVGPGGIFVLETKTRVRRKARRKQEEHKVIYDGQALIFPWCVDRKAIKQAERNAQWVQRYLAEVLPKNACVQAVVVIPGWYVETQGNYPVKVMEQSYLAENLLPKAKRLWAAEDLRHIKRLLDERCRNVEF